MKAFSLTSLHPNPAYQGKPTQPSFLRGQEEYPLGVRAEGESPRTSIWLSFFPEQAETTIRVPGEPAPSGSKDGEENLQSPHGPLGVPTPGPYRILSTWRWRGDSHLTEESKAQRG